MSRTLLLVLLVALPLALPASSAHVEEFSQAKTVPAGPYNVFLQPKPDVVFANTTLTMTAQAYLADTGSRARNVTATLVVAGPNDFSKRSAMRADGEYFLAAVMLPHPGNYSARILLQEGETTYNADTEIIAYRDLPIRVRSVNDEADTYVDEPQTLLFETVNRTTLRPVEGYDDLTIRIEAWSDDHTQMKGVFEAPLTRDAEGRWAITHTFKEQGMYHLKFASRAGGFTYDDVPILHTYASTRIDPSAGGNEGGEEGSRKVPLPGALLVVALACAALLAARRRAS